MSRSLVAVMAAVSVEFFADVASSQQRTKVERGQPQGHEGQAARVTQIGDHDLAHWVGDSNLVGLQVAQLGEQQAQSQEVRQFAQKLAQMYRAYDQQVQQAAPGLELPDRLAGTARSEIPYGARPGEPVPEEGRVRVLRPATERGEAGAGGVSLSQLHRDLAQKSAQSMTRALGEKEGQEFDKLS